MLDDPLAAEDNPVNEHYLERVVEAAQQREFEANEDIRAANGMKLLARGARIDNHVRERLLQYKLAKPLETLLRVVDGVGTRRIDQVADALLERHPLLMRVCADDTARCSQALREVVLNTQLDALLTVYAGLDEAKLEHAVGVALLALALGMRQLPEAEHPALLMAGLMHDVGELYIDPAFLRGGKALTPQQWKHVAAHPIVGARVLDGLPGAGAKVARIVLAHHERLDGFGYPRGLRAPALSAPDQALAVAELLMGLLEADDRNALQADVALKLMPGEFQRPLIDRVVTAARITLQDMGPAPRADDPGELLQRIDRLGAALAALRGLRALQQDAQAHGSDALRALLAHAVERTERLGVAYASTGLDSSVLPREERLQVLRADEQGEMPLVVRELQWRVRELERLMLVRSEALPPAEASRVQLFLTAIAS